MRRKVAFVKEIEKIVVEIDLEKEPYSENLVNIIKKKKEDNLNKWFESPEQLISSPPQGDTIKIESPEEIGYEKGIMDILGEYIPAERKIILYERNVEKYAEYLRNNLLKVFQCIALWKTDWHMEKFHFPIEFFFSKKALEISIDFNDWIKNLTHLFWYEIGKLKKGVEIRKFKKSLRYLKLNRCEIINLLTDVVFMHELGHAWHHILEGGSYYSDKTTVESFADLISLFGFDDVRHKVIFFSDGSYLSWYYYYKEEIYNNKSLIKKSGFDFIKALAQSILQP